MVSDWLTANCGRLYRLNSYNLRQQLVDTTFPSKQNSSDTPYDKFNVE
jgi:hypothetical protein